MISEGVLAVGATATAVVLELLIRFIKILQLFMTLVWHLYRQLVGCSSTVLWFWVTSTKSHWISCSVITLRRARASVRLLLMSKHRQACRNETKAASVKDSFFFWNSSYVNHKCPERVKTWTCARINWLENGGRQSSDVQTCTLLYIYDQANCAFISLISHFKQADKESEFWTLKNTLVDPLKVSGRVFSAYWIEDTLKSLNRFESVELVEFFLDLVEVFSPLRQTLWEPSR